MELKGRKTKTKDQLESLALMKQIAECREKIPYIRKSNDGTFHKNFFKHFTEGYVCDEFDLIRLGENNLDFDALTKDGKKVQIKEVTQSAPTIKKSMRFDYLVTVKLSKKDFSVEEIGVYPREVVKSHISPTNGTFRKNKVLESKYVRKVK